MKRTPVLKGPMFASDLALRLEATRGSDDAWYSGKCPAHDDQRASLTFRDGERGLVIKCHRGCSFEQIVAALHQQPADFFYEPKNGNHGPKIIATYNYFDRDGKLVSQTVRYAPKAFKQRRPDPVGDGWIWDLKDVELVLYRLPDMIRELQARPVGKRSVRVLEGEKDTDRLWDLGIIATTNPMGAGKWHDEYSVMLKAIGAEEIIIHPDNDRPGETHAKQVASGGIKAGLAVKVVPLPGLPPVRDKHGEDVSDWLDAGHTLEELEAVIAETPHAVADAASPSTFDDAEIGAATEDALALEFTRRHAENLLYVDRWGQWLQWDGHRWLEEPTLAVYDLARHLVRELNSSPKFQSAKTVNAIVTLARVDRRHARVVEAFDTDPWALNTPPGTVELQTGTMRPHRREDLITKVTAVSPSTDPAPQWAACLATWTNGDNELIAFLQRLCGYWCTGSVREEKIVIVWGPGGNGKTKFIETVRRALGTDYVTGVAMETLIVTHGEQHPTDMADLHGKRLAIAMETEEGRRLAESKLKHLSGGDRMRARKMRRDFFEFVPTHKIVIVGNHKPKLRNVDRAMRRRVVLIPFTAVISNPDDKLEEKLTAELPAILGWMLEGARLWREQGLNPPESVMAATDKYMSDADAIGRWIEEQCTTNVNALVTKSAAWDAWQTWAEAANEFAGTKTWFLDALGSREGVRDGTTGKAGAKCFFGIGLRPDAVRPRNTPYGVRLDSNTGTAAIQ